jgi:hypothetical protein
MKKIISSDLKLPNPHNWADVGVIPSISIYVRRLLDKPAYFWSNVGAKHNGLFSNAINRIKKICGYRWGNGIEYLYFYEGAHYKFPFHVHIHFEKTKNRKGISIPLVKTGYHYYFTIYDPITCMPIQTFSDKLTNWDDTISPEHVGEAANLMKRFVDEILNTKDLKQKIDDFKRINTRN